MKAARDRGGPDPSPAQINTQSDWSFWSAHFVLRFLDGPAFDVDDRAFQAGDRVACLKNRARLGVLNGDIADSGISLVGTIQSGVPSPAIPLVGLSDLWALLFPAAGLALLAYADSVVTAESLARPAGYRIDTNQEFFGLGVSR